MDKIPDNLELEYVKVYNPGNVPKLMERVRFASREIFTENAWDHVSGLLKPQQYVRVLNPDIWGGKIRYPFESEFSEVKK
jgi:hypothetical protein